MRVTSVLAAAVVFWAGFSAQAAASGCVRGGGKPECDGRAMAVSLPDGDLERIFSEGTAAALKLAGSGSSDDDAYSAALLAWALSSVGYADEAGEYLRGFRARQGEDGSLSASLAGHGALAWALVRWGRTSRSVPAISEALAAMRKAADYVLRLAGDRPGGGGTLLPPSVLWSGRHEAFASPVADAWCAVALEEMSMMAARLGEVEDARRYAAGYARLSAGVRRVLAEAGAGGALVPGGRPSWWADRAASMLLASGLVEPGLKAAGSLVEIASESPDLGYLQAVIARAPGSYLEALRLVTGRKPAEFSAAHLGEREAAAERAASLVLGVRWLLVHESEGAVDLLGGVPGEWTAPGTVLGCRGAQTPFGSVDVSVSFDEAGLAADVAASWWEQPSELRLRLGRPGTVIASAECYGVDELRVEGEWLRMSRPSGRVHVRVDWGEDGSE